MHRTKVKVVEDALDANNTIARANRDDFDRAGVISTRASRCSKGTCREASTPTASPASTCR